ncbi:MAG: hypothetical protein A2Y21_02125 [Clostridiales bacterium GWC2_40_7]|nr:MAG: hypothetical protein A2Y21_02125 [Clostridiales bacterium GWC2_40_7]
MKIPYYDQLTPQKTLRLYCDWLLEQQVEDPAFFRIYERGGLMYEWYMVFYPVRTLMLGGRLLNERKYIDAALKYVDIYLTEQLPNGAFTSTYRRQPTANLTREQYHHVMRTGNVNIADNGSNVTAIVLAAEHVDGEKRAKYIEAARKWFDEFIPIWSLPEGGYNNGKWAGRVSTGPYTCAISTLVVALSAFGKATGDYYYVENAESCIKFQCENWFCDDDGRPVNFDSYRPVGDTGGDARIALEDFGHSFYLLEGMCWTHSASKNEEIKKLIESKLKIWIHGKRGLLSQWGDSWFNFMVAAYPWQKGTGDPPTSRQSGIRIGWEMAKSNGIMQCFQYYLNNIDDSPRLREKVELGLKYLTAPIKCRMSGVMSDPDESYGAFAVQSTGFAGLSVSEAVEKNSSFSMTKVI